LCLTVVSDNVSDSSDCSRDLLDTDTDYTRWRRSHFTLAVQHVTNATWLLHHPIHKSCFFTSLSHYCKSRPTVNYVNHKSLKWLFETPIIGTFLLVSHSWVTPTLWSHPSVSERFLMATQKLFCVGTSQLCIPTWGPSIDQPSCKVCRQSRRGKYCEGQQSVNKYQSTLVISQKLAWSQASVEVQIRPLIFWDVTQHLWVCSWRRFGIYCWYHLKNTLEDGADWLSRNVGK